MPHVDPSPNPQLMGWGDPTLQVHHNLVRESRSLEKMYEAKPHIFCDGFSARGASPMNPKIEKVIRSKFKFDAGWDFMVAERFVYRLTDAQTLMVAQLIGNCVGDSHCCLLASRIAHEILCDGDAEEKLGIEQLGIPFIPYSYGAGRMVGGMLGPSDGSYCGAQIEASMTHGFLPCYTPGLDVYGGTLPQASANANRLFGKSKAEIMKWEPKALQFDLEEAPKIKSADEAWTAIVDKKIPLQICSGQGFKYKGRDENGVEIYVPGGSWPHSLQVVAAFQIKSQRYKAIRNQWGYDAHKGSPNQGIVGGVFVITYETFDRWVKNSETIGIGSIKGLPSKPSFE